MNISLHFRQLRQRWIECALCALAIALVVAASLAQREVTLSAEKSVHDLLSVADVAAVAFQGVVVAAMAGAGASLLPAARAARRDPTRELQEA